MCIHSKAFNSIVPLPGESPSLSICKLARVSRSRDVRPALLKTDPEHIILNQHMRAVREMFENPLIRTVFVKNRIVFVYTASKGLWRAGCEILFGFTS